MCEHLWKIGAKVPEPGTRMSRATSPSNWTVWGVSSPNYLSNPLLRTLRTGRSSSTRAAGCSKTYRRVGWVLAAVSAVYAVTLVVAVLGGNSSAPWLPLSGQDKKHAEEVEVRPAPSGDVVSESPGATPGAPASSASGSAAALASGGASASGSAAPAASAPASAVSKPTKGASTSSAPVPGAPVSEQPSGEPSPSVTTEPPVEESP